MIIYILFLIFKDKSNSFIYEIKSFFSKFFNKNFYSNFINTKIQYFLEIKNNLKLLKNKKIDVYFL